VKPHSAVGQNVAEEFLTHVAAKGIRSSQMRLFRRTSGGRVLVAMLRGGGRAKGLDHVEIPRR